MKKLHFFAEMNTAKMIETRSVLTGIALMTVLNVAKLSFPELNAIRGQVNE